MTSSPQELCVGPCDHTSLPACLPADWAMGGFHNQSSSSVDWPTACDMAEPPYAGGPQLGVTVPALLVSLTLSHSHSLPPLIVPLEFGKKLVTVDLF